VGESNIPATVPNETARYVKGDVTAVNCATDPHDRWPAVMLTVVTVSARTSRISEHMSAHAPGTRSSATTVDRYKRNSGVFG
jgi:hypothetical protein